MATGTNKNTVSNTNEQVYNANGVAPANDRIANIISILLPRGVVVAAYNQGGEVLSIRCNEYSSSLPVWMEGFYEERFDNDVLFTQKAVKAFFIGDERTFVIPKVLYNEVDAKAWMDKLQFTGKSEVAETSYLKASKAYYLYAWPLAIKNLVARYFPKTEIYPLGSCQFGWATKADSFLQCTLSSEAVYASLYANNILQWHQVFDYVAAEDIAYRIKQLCKDNGIDAEKLVFECNTTQPGLDKVLDQLTGYFPQMNDFDKPEGVDAKWVETVDLLQQIHKCAL